MVRNKYIGESIRWKKKIISIHLFGVFFYSFSVRWKQVVALFLIKKGANKKIIPVVANALKVPHKFIRLRVLSVRQSVFLSANFIYSYFRFQINEITAISLSHVIQIIIIFTCYGVHFCSCVIWPNPKFDNHFHFTSIPGDKKSKQTNHFFQFFMVFCFFFFLFIAVNSVIWIYTKQWIQCD